MGSRPRCLTGGDPSCIPGNPSETTQEERSPSGWDILGVSDDRLSWTILGGLGTYVHCHQELAQGIDKEEG